MTQWDMPQKVKDKLGEHFGSDVVAGLIVIDIERVRSGLGAPFLKIFGGLMLIPLALFFTEIMKAAVFLALWIPFRIIHALKRAIRKA